MTNSVVHSHATELATSLQFSALYMDIHPQPNANSNRHELDAFLHAQFV